VTRRLAALALLALAAGCGGGESRPLDRVGYEVRLAPLDDLLAQSFDRDNGHVAGKLRALADELATLKPPAPAIEPNADLVRVLRYLAEDVEARDTLAFADDWERLQDVVYAFRERGFEPFDGPDDE
jgi:hypothetical protein